MIHSPFQGEQLRVSVVLWRNERLWSTIVHWSEQHHNRNRSFGCQTGDSPELPSVGIHSLKLCHLWLCHILEQRLGLTRNIGHMLHEVWHLPSMSRLVSLLSNLETALCSPHYTANVKISRKTSNRIREQKTPNAYGYLLEYEFLATRTRFFFNQLFQIFISTTDNIILNALQFKFPMNGQHSQEFSCNRLISINNNVSHASSLLSFEENLQKMNTFEFRLVPFPRFAGFLWAICMFLHFYKHLGHQYAICKPFLL